jgi:glutamine amidotransferase
LIAIVDYGMGNLRSVEKALQKLGHHAAITTLPAEIRAADRVILPGVGAFGAAMANLEQPVDGDGPLIDAVLEAARSGRPFLGICLGMQLLLSESDEMGVFRGLDLIPGRVVRCAVFQRGNLFATQFHPEKSGDVGLRMLDNFARLPADGA